MTDFDVLINNAVNLIKVEPVHDNSNSAHLLLCEELRYVQQKIAERTYPRTYDKLPSMDYAEEKITEKTTLNAIKEVNKWYKCIYCRKGL